MRIELTPLNLTSLFCANILHIVPHDKATRKETKASKSMMDSHSRRANRKQVASSSSSSSSPAVNGVDIN